LKTFSALVDETGKHAVTTASEVVMNARKNNHTRNLIALILLLVEVFGVAVVIGSSTLVLAQGVGPGWTYTGSLSRSRWGHTATLLSNGKVLVVGGAGFPCSGGFCYSTTNSSAELYDPSRGTWSYTGNLQYRRHGHTATLLQSSEVLISGGSNSGYDVGAFSRIDVAELYNPATGQFRTTGSFTAIRVGVSATLLPNGKVLALGGSEAMGRTLGVPVAELYDPAAGSWKETRAPSVFGALLLLPNGKVLVAGSACDENGQSCFRGLELYDPTAESWSPSVAPSFWAGSTTLLPNGKVLALGSVGDNPFAGIYDPGSETWSLINAPNVMPYSATRLSNGKILVIGGYDFERGITNSAELYDPVTGTWSATGSLNAARIAYSTTLLPNGKVLIAGGVNGDFDSYVESLSSAELYDPGINQSNPIDDPKFFARQHYLDFLNREPDVPGWAHWTGEITMCSDPAKRFQEETEAQCFDRKRTNTSGAFFLSNELQNSASFLLRVYWGGLGKLPNSQCIVGAHSALPALCRPLYSQYIADMTKLTQGIVGNDQLSPDAMNANRRAFTDEFVTRPEFAAVYGNLSDAGYVDKLQQTTGVPLTAQERQDLITEAGTANGRASVLYKIVDGTTTIADGNLRFDTRYGKAFYDQEFNTAFVFMQYLGYLRRNPDQAGYDHWLAKLRLYGNFVDAEMVRSFLVSDEYRSRFSQP
jgi:hypothetical protein